MRQLIINKINKTKSINSDFKSDKWKGFMIGGFHISEVLFDGMPDGFLVDVYDEIIRWDAKEKTKDDFSFFKNKVEEMLNTQQLYFKSNKDFDLLKRSKGLEKEVRELIHPKPKQQGILSFEFLAQ